MTGVPANVVGLPVEAIPTPAMCVDIELLDANIARMAAFFAGRQARLRPHFKSHKCLAIARRQLSAGAAVGITAAKLSEAEVLVAGGIDDVLIANQVVGQAKSARLAELNRQAAVRVAVDDADNVAELGQAARSAGVTVGVLVEVDIGMKRCGVPPGEPALSLARVVAGTPGLRFDGLQGYEGHLVLLADAAAKNEQTIAAMNALVATRRLIESAGLPVAIVSGGGTGTYDITGQIDGVDEVQAGSYALMDACYARLRPEFANAMFVLATIVSAGPGRAVADVGTKGLGCEFGPPVLPDRAPATVARVAEEHAIIHGLRDDAPVNVGDRVRLIPSHGCTTSNLHRRMFAIRGGIVQAVWPIEASGCLE